MVRPLVKTHIRGFDEDVLRGGIPQGHVVLVRGASGTMKSSLAYYVLYHNALAGSPGLYVTLEQTAAGLLEHVAGLGLKATSVSEALPILALSRGRHRGRVPASRAVREDAEREPGQRRPHPPLRERAVRGRAGDRVSRWTPASGLSWSAPDSCS